MISQKSKYALRALLALARVAPGETMRIAAIAARETIPKKFLEQILLELKRAGLVASRRGKHGGYLLLRRPEEIVFGEVLRLMEARGIPTGVAHLANSAATLTNPSAHFDMVRPGLAIYGLSPVPDLGRPEDFGLREAMRVRARLTTVKRARAGQGVSYAHQYVTDRDTVLGIVPVGYADGVPRSASSAGPVRVGERTLTVAGRVCMDQFVVDLGPDFDGAEGDVVTLLGVGVAGEPTAQDWAVAAGTINYEIVTRMGPRLPRVVVGEA